MHFFNCVLSKVTSNSCHCIAHKDFFFKFILEYCIIKQITSEEYSSSPLFDNFVPTKYQQIISKTLEWSPIAPQQNFTYLESTMKRLEIWSKLTIKTAEQRQWHRPFIFTVNFEHNSYLFLLLLLLTLNKRMFAGPLALLWNVYFEQNLWIVLMFRLLIYASFCLLDIFKYSYNSH